MPSCVTSILDPVADADLRADGALELFESVEYPRAPPPGSRSAFDAVDGSSTGT